jgi:methionyl-tRNA formyltransferase
MSKISRVLFLGSKQLGLRVLQEMHLLSPATLMGVVTIDDTTDTRTKFADFQVFAERHGVELRVAKNRKHSEQIIEELKPDLCLVVGWYWLISNAVLDTVPFGFIGIHNSLLPRFRGGSPLIWPIIRGEREVGFSFFSLAPGLDDGPIWAQGSVSVAEDDYISSVLKRLEEKAIDVLRDTYPRLLGCSIKPVEQNHELATYCAQRFPGDGNINWHEPARAVYNFIRAQSDPYPGAFTYLEGRELRIWKARLFRNPYLGTPGQVARRASDGVYVICGDDRAIILEEMESGGKRGQANDFIKSIKGRMSNVASTVTQQTHP